MDVTAVEMNARLSGIRIADFIQKLDNGSLLNSANQTDDLSGSASGYVLLQNRTAV